MRHITPFIDGASVAGTSGRYGDVFNPNTGEVQARVALSTAAEVDKAVASALRAQQTWALVAHRAPRLLVGAIGVGGQPRDRPPACRRPK